MASCLPMAGWFLGHFLVLLVVVPPFFPRTWIRLEITSLMNVGLCCLHDVVQKKEWKSWVWNIYNFMEDWVGSDQAMALQRDPPQLGSHTVWQSETPLLQHLRRSSFPWSLATEICSLTEGSDRVLTLTTVVIKAKWTSSFPKRNIINATECLISLVSSAHPPGGLLFNILEYFLCHFERATPPIQVLTRPDTA